MASETVIGGIKIPSCCPFSTQRNGLYARTFALLYAHRQTGISRDSLTKLLIHSGASKEQTRYAVAIVLSARDPRDTEWRPPHRCASSASDVYFVQRNGSWLKLVLRDAEDLLPTGTL